MNYKNFFNNENNNTLTLSLAHSGVVIGNATSQQEAFKSTGRRKLFSVHILHLPAWVPFRYSNYLPQPKHMHAC